MMRIVLATLLMLVPMVSHASIEQNLSPENQQRYQMLVDELRCVTCNNQTIGDSGSLSAVAMKEQVAAMLAAGKSDEQILNLMVDTYGEKVRYTPPVKGVGLLIWSLPVMGLLLGLFILLGARRKRSKPMSTDRQTDLEQARALLKDKS